MTEPTMSPAQEFADALIAGFIAAGGPHVVVAPGSRSQALALAAVEAQRAGTVCVHVRIDERGAGFFALGLAVESRIPAVVIVTSGTALPNLHPAVLEAHHAGVPLIVLSADRPAQLRGIRSNQTTKQPGMFQSEVRREWDIPTPDGAAHEVTAAEGYAVAAVAAARGLAEDRPVCPTPGPGPVHVNVQLGEPLSGARLRGGAWRGGVGGGVGRVVLACSTVTVTPARGSNRGNRNDFASTGNRCHCRCRCRCRRRGVRSNGRLAAHCRGHQRCPIRPEPRARISRGAGG